jgi:hypothetical protein
VIIKEHNKNKEISALADLIASDCYFIFLQSRICSNLGKGIIDSHLPIGSFNFIFTKILLIF